MKKFEFETSKGRFVIKDLNFIPLDCKGIKLSEITEEQASEIVDFEDGCRLLYGYAKNKLHSLFKSNE